MAENHKKQLLSIQAFILAIPQKQNGWKLLNNRGGTRLVIEGGKG